MFKTQKKFLPFLILAFALLFCSADTSFAFDAMYSRPFGAAPKTHADVKWYIDINQTSQHDDWGVTGIHHGWAITGADVLTCVKNNSSTENEIAFDIALSSETTQQDAIIGLYADREFDYEGCMAVSLENYGFSKYAFMDWESASIETAENGNKIDVELSGNEASIIVYVCFDASSEENEPIVKEYTFNFKIAAPDTSTDPDPGDVKSIEISGNPQKAYFEGQTFDRLGLTVTAIIEGTSEGKTVQGYKAMPQHVFEEYKSEFLEKYINDFYEMHNIDNEEELLTDASLTEEFQEYKDAFDAYFEGEFGKHIEDFFWGPATGGLDADDGKDYRLAFGDTYVLIFFGSHSDKVAGITVNATAGISEVSISNGQMMDEWFFVSYNPQKKKNRFDAVVLHGNQYGEFTFKASSGAEVYVGDSQTPETADGEGVYRVNLATSDSLEGITTTVTVKAKVSNGTGYELFEKPYAFTCYSQRFGDMPAEVVEYLPMASQYTNGMFISGVFGLDPVRTLRGLAMGSPTGWGNNTECVSLGNFGGYIIYRYAEPIRDDPNNPWGVDFIVYGNSNSPNNGFAEPGNVLVSTDGKEWFTLAGSAHYEDYAKWDHWITYKNEGGRAAWTDKNGGSGFSFSYPMKERYPHFNWTAKPNLEKEMTLEGVFLEGSNGKATRFPDFGYADTGKPLSDSNEAGNPYVGIVNGNRTTMDGFDLRWAVDEAGKPVDLSGTGIYYVKIQTASFIINGEASSGGTGEKSTEVNGVRLAGARASDVGVTGAPAGISVEGVNVLEYGERDAEYEKDYVYNDVAVTGKFTVAVDAPGANVYINGERGAARTFEKMPDHGMVRVIVQEGDKRPVIYYLSLKEVPGEDRSTTVTLDASGGEIVGLKAPTADLLFTPHSPDGDRTFPEAVNIGHTFAGWFAEGNDTPYTGYTDDMPETLTLTARWEEEGEPPAAVATVKFDARGGALPAGTNAEPEYKPGMTFPTPTRAGYAFAGWYRGDSVQTGYNEALKGVQGLTFEAHWTLKITTVSFDAGEGLFTSTGNAARIVPYSIESANKSFPTPVREGYTFDGWFDSKGAEHKAYSTALADTPELSLTAKWAKDDSGNNNNNSGGNEESANDTNTNTDTGNEGEYSVDRTDPAKPAVTVPSVTEVTGNSETGAAATTTTVVAAGSLSGAIEKAVKEASDAGSAEPVITIRAEAPEAGGVKAAAVEIPAGDLKEIAESGENVSVKIESPVGEVTLDSGAVKALVSDAEAAGAETVSAVIERKDDPAADETLTPEQRTAALDAEVRAVYDISLFADGRALGGFATTAENGRLTVGLPYRLDAEAGEAAAGVQPAYLPEVGGRVPMNEGKKYERGLSIFQTDHLSVYAVTYVQRSAEDAADTGGGGGGWGQAGGSGPGGGCGTGVTGSLALLTLALAIARKRRAA